jgi:GT2 family glycosyltransferase
MERKELVAIIVLNYNKKNDILECLNSIFKLDYKEFEVIVVDNGSIDGSAQEIKTKYPEVHLIKSEINLGVASGRNLGVQFAEKNLKYKSILFLDDDIIIDRRALSEMITSFDTDRKIGIVTPKCYLTSIPGVIGYAGGMFVNLYTGRIANIGNGKKDEGQFDESRFIQSCGGLCLISRELINTVGTFDEKFNPYGWEDVDLSLRSRKNGFKIFYNHKAIVYHKGGKTGRGKAVNIYEFSKSKNYFYLIKKHSNILQLISIGLCFPFRTIFIIIKELMIGEFNSISAQVRGIISIFKKSDS